MSVILSTAVRRVLRTYTLVLLVVAAVLLSSASAFVPLALFGFYVYLMLPKRDPSRWAKIVLIADYFTFFAVGLFLEPRLGLLSVLPALPLLGAISISLSRLAKFADLARQSRPLARQPANTVITMGITSIVVLVFSVVLSNQLLALASAVTLIYLVLAAWLQSRFLPLVPLAVDPVPLRMLAGSTATVTVKLSLLSGNIGKLGFYSPYDWVKIEPVEIIPQAGRDFNLQVSLKPSLSGPTGVELVGTVTDLFGLLQHSFRFAPVMLQVIPRARYAAWFARQYARGTRRGSLPLLASINISRGAVTSPTGIEYYGSRLYQPGDSVRVVDWKHSIKLVRLISKDFSEMRGEKALLLVNLVASDAEKADRLAYNIIAAGLSMAHDKIPAAIAAYDAEKVRLVTAILTPVAMVARALGLSQQVVIAPDPSKYLGPVDVMQFRILLSRLRQAGDGPARLLADLLDVEFRSLMDGARHGPVSSALVQAFNTVGQQCNVVVISGKNHDAEALAFNTHELRRRGCGIIEV